MTVTALGDGPGGGNSDGELSLREAIYAIQNTTAVDGIGPTSGMFGVNDRIDFAATLTGTINLLSSEGELLIQKSVAIDGPGANELTISGPGTGHRVINIQAIGEAVEISGVTITGGDEDSFDGGGGILTDSPLTLRESLITGNEAFNAVGGGVAANGQAELTVIDSIVSDNYAFNGGGIFATNNFTLTNSVVSENDAFARGAGILVEAGSTAASIVIDHSRIQDNRLTDNPPEGPSSGSGGGGIHVETGGTLTVRYSAITGNHAGHFFAASAQEGNRGSGNGGGIFSSADSGTHIFSSLIANNTSKGAGGGVHIASSPASTIINSTISNNNAVEGGGAYISDAQLIHCTITMNQAGYFEYPDFLVGEVFNWGGGGGIQITAPTQNEFSQYVLDATIHNTIIAGNLSAPPGPYGEAEVLDSGNGTSPDIGFAVPIAFSPPLPQDTFENNMSVRYSLIGSTEGPLGDMDFEPEPDEGLLFLGPGNQLNVDPRLGPLLDNGGQSLTHALLLVSPAIDAGDPTPTNPPEFDQRGAPFARIVDWLGVEPDSGPHVDIGAFELQLVDPGEADADFDQDGDVDGTDFLTWQRGIGTTGAAQSQGDADADQDVDGDDLTVWRATFGDQSVVTAARPLASLTSVASGEAWRASDINAALFRQDSREFKTFLRSIDDRRGTLPIPPLAPPFKGGGVETEGGDKVEESPIERLLEDFTGLDEAFAEL